MNAEGVSETPKTKPHQKTWGRINSGTTGEFLQAKMKLKIRATKKKKLKPQQCFKVLSFLSHFQNTAKREHKQR